MKRLDDISGHAAWESGLILWTKPDGGIIKEICYFSNRLVLCSCLNVEIHNDDEFHELEDNGRYHEINEKELISIIGDKELSSKILLRLNDVFGYGK